MPICGIIGGIMGNMMTMVISTTRIHTVGNGRKGKREDDKKGEKK